MKFKRGLLAAELGVISPAIADKSKISGLECIWFDGKTASTYNTIIGIEKPIETDFIGGLPGKVLTGYLDRIQADEVDFATKQTDLSISAGQSKLKLSLQDINNKLWKFPDFDKSNKLVLTKDLLTLLEHCSISINKNSSMQDPEFNGVTFETTREDLNIYTTDVVSLSFAWIGRTKDYTLDRVTVPKEFIEQLLKICMAEDTLYLSPTAAVAINRSGTKLFGHILEVDNPRDFAGELDKSLPNNDKYIGLPAELESALDRAELLVSGSYDTVQLSLSGEVLHLYLNNPTLGELNDSIEVEDSGEGIIEADFDPSFIKRALKERTFLAMTPRCLVMTGPETFIHLVAARHT
jgi:DNA polymerase III sliding clamp (beta) subunit (PCNA family)